MFTLSIILTALPCLLATSCGELKNAYQDSACCGAPPSQSAMFAGSCRSGDVSVFEEDFEYWCVHISNRLMHSTIVHAPNASTRVLTQVNLKANATPTFTVNKMNPTVTYEELVDFYRQNAYVESFGKVHVIAASDYTIEFSVDRTDKKKEDGITPNGAMWRRKIVIAEQGGGVTFDYGSSLQQHNYDGEWLWAWTPERWEAEGRDYYLARGFNASFIADAESPSNAPKYATEGIMPYYTPALPQNKFAYFSHPCVKVAKGNQNLMEYGSLS